MVALPAPTAVITPEVGLTVATKLLLLVQVPPAVPLLVKVVSEPAQMVAAPLIVPALASALMVMLAEAAELPQVLLTVYVMVALPTPTPVTTPVTGSTVAAAVLLLVQVPPPVPLLVNTAVAPWHITAVPLTVPAVGSEPTVTTADAVATPHTEDTV